VDLSRPQGGAAGDSGFTLIEMVIALMLLTVVITAFANGFVGALFASGDAQMKEVAVTVADTALDKARAVTPASNLLLEGPAAGTVSSNVVLTNTSNAVVLDPQTTTLDSRVFTANLYAGSCYLQATGQCTTTAPSNPTPMIRVIAYVTWSAPGCGNCSYVASTLISNGNDSILNINPNAAPGAPGSPTAAAGNDQVTVSWTAPVSEYPVSGYTATVTGGAQSCNTSTSTSCTVTGLTNGTAYTFTVTATSAGGTSVPSSATPPVTPTDPPLAPSNVAAAVGNDMVTVSWAAETSPPSAYPVSGYTVTASTTSTGTGAGSWTTSSTSYPVTGLTNGDSYTFSVVAISSGGTSPASAVTATPTDPPAAPINLTATPGNTTVAVSWTAVSSPPSAYPISGYTVTATAASGSGGSCTSTTPTPPAATCTVTGLTNGVSYSFTVTATSSGGLSPSSTPAVNATPLPPPGAPTGLTAPSTTSNSVTLSWTAPTVPSPALPVTGYTVTATAAGHNAGSCTVSAPLLTCTVSGLSNLVTYTFGVVTTYAGGTSPSSPTVNAKP
jgi:prepilin-type N-terminal cleavage/methylation domain-containing protein